MSTIFTDSKTITLTTPAGTAQSYTITADTNDYISTSISSKAVSSVGSQYKSTGTSVKTDVETIKKTSTGSNWITASSPLYDGAHNQTGWDTYSFSTIYSSVYNSYNTKYSTSTLSGWVTSTTFDHWNYYTSYKYVNVNNSYTNVKTIKFVFDIS